MISAVAQPALRTTYPVLNSASYMNPTTPAGGIAQGSVFTLFGSGLGPSSFASATTFPLSTVLAGTSVTVTVGDTSTHAIMLWDYFGLQIAAALPSSTPVGSGTITVTYNGQTSAPAAIQVVPTAFGIYAANYQKLGQVVATDPSFNSNSIIHTFHPGDVGILWGTGLGPVTWDETQPPTAADVANSLPVATQVYVGNSAAVTGYHGRSGCCTGLDQIVFTVPAGVEGCYVPVGVQAGGVMSNITTIAVSSSGQTCGDSPLGQDLVDKLASGQNVSFGYIRLEGGAYFGGDGGFATFNQFTPATATWASFAPSAGYCVAVDCSQGLGCATNGNVSLTDLTFPMLDAGPAITLTGSSGTTTLQNFGGGSYFNINLGNGQRYLWGGSRVSVSNGTGGGNVGTFATSDTVAGLASPFTNVVWFQSIPLANDLKLTWDSTVFPQPNGVATIGAYSASEGFQQGVLLQCTVPVAANQFTIPKWVLGQLPVGGLNGQAFPTGALWIGQYGTPTTFSAPGLDKGIITDITYYVRQVGFQ